MPFSIALNQDKQILTLEGGVTVRDVHDLAAELSARLEDGMPVEVDTAKLEDIDTSVLQLLYALSKTIPALSFDQPSDFFVGAVDRRGLRRELLKAREDL